MTYPRIEKMKVADLRPADYNPREITDEALSGLGASIERFGVVEIPVFNRHTGNLVGGHQRLKVLSAKGTEEVDVMVVELDEIEEKALNVTLNNPEIAGTYTDGLQDILAEIAEHDDSWMESLNLGALLEDLHQEPEKSTESDPPPPQPPRNPVTKRGDVWTLGDHRIICGDCRVTKDVQKVLGKSSINVAFTSPPYASQRKYDESSGFKPIRPDDYVEWFCDVQANVARHLADDGSWFVNIKEHCDGGQRHLYVKDLTIGHVREWGWLFVDEFCWRDTKNGVPGGWPNRFKDAWEPVFHFSKSSKLKFRPLANGTKTDATFAYSPDHATSKSGSGLLGARASDNHAGIARPSNVVEVAAGSTGAHSAEFPVGLPEFFVKAFSDDGDLIFDPFMGSGTTMIAAQRNDRRSAGCEISPAYCDVIVERWEQETGGKATRR